MRLVRDDDLIPVEDELAAPLPDEGDASSEAELADGQVEGDADPAALLDTTFLPRR